MKACDKNGKELKVGDIVTITFRPTSYAPIKTISSPILEIFYYSGIHRVKLLNGKTKTGKDKYIRFMCIQVEKVD